MGTTANTLVTMKGDGWHMKMMTLEPGERAYLASLVRADHDKTLKDHADNWERCRLMPFTQPGRVNEKKWRKLTAKRAGLRQRADMAVHLLKKLGAWTDPVELAHDGPDPNPEQPSDRPGGTEA